MTATEQLIALAQAWQLTAAKLQQAIDQRDFRAMRYCWQQGQQLFKQLQPQLSNVLAAAAETDDVRASVLQAVEAWQQATASLGQWQSLVADELHQLRSRNKRGNQLKNCYGCKGGAAGRNLQINVRVRRS